MEVAGIVIFILVIAGLYGLVTLYSKFLLSGMATRVVATGLPIEQIRNVFVQKVAGSTWKIVDDGNPMIAQSPLLTGIRQQIVQRFHSVHDSSRCGCLFQRCGR